MKKAISYKKLLFGGVGALGVSGTGVLGTYMNSLRYMNDVFEGRFLDWKGEENKQDWDKLASSLKESSYKVNKFDGLSGITDAEKLKKWCESNIKKRISTGVFSTKWQQKLENAIRFYCFMPMGNKLKQPTTADEYKIFDEKFKEIKNDNSLTTKELKKIKSMEDNAGSKELMLWCLGAYTYGYINPNDNLWKEVQKYCQATTQASQAK